MGVEQGPSNLTELFIQACLPLGIPSTTLLWWGILPVIFRWRVRLGQQVVSASAGKAAAAHLQVADVAIAQLDEIQIGKSGQKRNFVQL